MTDPITRLTAARFDGPQALFTEAVRLLSERTKLPDDLAGLVARLRGEKVFMAQDAADAIEALAAENARLTASEPTCAVVKPLVWEPSINNKPWHSAKAPWGWYYAQWDDETEAWFASLEMGEVEGPIILQPSDVQTIDAAKAAAQADYEARILSAITMRPEAEVRAEAWAAAIEAAAVKCIPWSLACSEEISALTQPADVSAALDRIKAEAKAEGMREAALALLHSRASDLLFCYRHGNGLDGWHKAADGLDDAINKIEALKGGAA